MKKITRGLQALACGMCVIAMAPSALAEVKPGFFVGLSVGKSSFDLQKREFDDIVLDVFASLGAPVITGSSTLEDSDNSKALVLGYRFNPYISIEGTYIDLGTAEYRSSGTVNPPGPIASTPASVLIDLETKGFTVAALGSIPIGTSFDLHGRLGLFVADTDLSVGVSMSTSTNRQSDTLDSQGAFYGVGAGLGLGDHWSLSLDWTRYDNVGDQDEDDDVETEGGIDIDAVSFSATYRF